MKYPISTPSGDIVISFENNESKADISGSSESQEYLDSVLAIGVYGNGGIQLSRENLTPSSVSFLDSIHIKPEADKSLTNEIEEMTIALNENKILDSVTSLQSIKLARELSDIRKSIDSGELSGVEMLKQAKRIKEIRTAITGANQAVSESEEISEDTPSNFMENEAVSHVANMMRDKNNVTGSTGDANKDPLGLGAMWNTRSAVEKKVNLLASDITLEDINGLIDFLESKIEDYNGLSPIPKTNAQKYVSETLNPIKAGLEGANEMPVTDEAVRLYREENWFAPEFYDSDDYSFASYASAKAFTDRVQEESSRRAKDDYLASDAHKAGLAIAESLSDRDFTSGFNENKFDRNGNDNFYSKKKIGDGEMRITIERGYQDKPSKLRAIFRGSSDRSGSGIDSRMKIWEFDKVEDLNIASIESEIDVLTNSFKTVVDTSNVPAYGSKYGEEGTRNGVDIAKKLRTHIAEGKKNGDLPKGLKLSIKSTYSKVDVDIKDTAGIKIRPDAFYKWREEESEKFWSYNDVPSNISLFTRDYKALQNYIEGYANAYNYDNSDSMTDYFDTNFYLSVGTTQEADNKDFEDYENRKLNDEIKDPEPEIEQKKSYERFTEYKGIKPESDFKNQAVYNIDDESDKAISFEVDREAKTITKSTHGNDSDLSNSSYAAVSYSDSFMDEYVKPEIDRFLIADNQNESVESGGVSSEFDIFTSNGFTIKYENPLVLEKGIFKVWRDDEDQDSKFWHLEYKSTDSNSISWKREKEGVSVEDIYNHLSKGMEIALLDINIGREWDSIHGRQKIQRIYLNHENEPDMYEVDTIDGKGGVRRYRVSGIETTIANDERNASPEGIAKNKKDEDNRLKGIEIDKKREVEAQEKLDGDTKLIMESGLFKVSKLNPMNLGRLKKSLLKTINYKGEHSSLLDLLVTKTITSKEKTSKETDHNRRKFNRMNNEEQDAYDKKLKAGRYYWAVFGDGGQGVSIDKVVFDVLNAKDKTEYSKLNEDAPEIEPEVEETPESTGVSSNNHIVSNTNNGKEINKNFIQWQKIKTPEESEAWKEATRKLTLGTYNTDTILDQIDNFDPKEGFLLESYKEEIKKALISKGIAPKDTNPEEDLTAEINSLKTESNIETFDDRLDALADKIESLGLMDKYESSLEELADILTGLMSGDNILDSAKTHIGKRVVSIAQDDYDDGVQTLNLTYSDGTKSTERRIWKSGDFMAFGSRKVNYSKLTKKQASDLYTDIKLKSKLEIPTKGGA